MGRGSTRRPQANACAGCNPTTRRYRSCHLGECQALCDELYAGSAATCYLGCSHMALKGGCKPAVGGQQSCRRTLTAVRRDPDLA